MQSAMQMFVVRFASKDPRIRAATNERRLYLRSPPLMKPLCAPLYDGSVMFRRAQFTPLSCRYLRAALPADDIPPDNSQPI